MFCFVKIGVIAEVIAVELTVNYSVVSKCLEAGQANA